MIKTKTTSARSLPSWAVTGLVAALAVLYTLFIFLPTQRNATKLRSKKYELMQYVSNQTKMSDKIEKALQRQRDIEVTTTNWLQQAPRAGDVGRNLSAITQHARGAGVIIQRFDPQPMVPLKVVAQQSISVALEGNFQQVFDFLERVETMPHRVWITNLTVSSASEDAQTLRAEMTLTIFADLAENSGSAKST
ncbi:Pilus assembly protein, PilO [Anatilimnocola aggregata]|uniref:Pilus assembly protein, PilO n=1 Tax=Anatilimnocola aggregata TaxID=2528021 RepID=A0A517YF60_9BACT|nr:type 4a pilus biogenesis protein PilO [Anatilimnocola aggregata]QDU28782.1 Pilus assembly protein, PilO [Anatilimnocola aggregata]